MTRTEKLELLLDIIAEQLILSEIVNSELVADNQKTIQNGQLILGRLPNERLVLYQKDIEANKKDLLLTTPIDTDEDGVPDTDISRLEEIANRIEDFDNVLVNISLTERNNYTITIEGDGLEGEENIDFIYNDVDNNPLNVSQFIPIQQQSTIIDIDNAREYLDTNIFELLPTSDTRQNRILRFFDELNALLPPIPEFDNDGDGFVDRENGNWIGSDDYSTVNDISSENPDGDIVRLSDDAESPNEGKTLEDIYNTILPYLTDILEDEVSLEDDRPIYRNQSNGYLKFRDLNQGIIIRNTNQDFVEGLDPSNPTYLNTDGTGGFTITMWVRFLDKVSEGTLFNFGNPLREDNPFGFSLETYVINADDTPNPSGFNGASGKTWGQIFRDGGDGGTITYEAGLNDVGQGFFSESNTERFVRLIVREQNDDGTVGKLRDSHLGASWMARYPTTPQLGFNHTSEPPSDPEFSHHFGLMKNTRIPEDFNEWYFICATYNPIVDEEYGFTNNQIGNYSNIRYEPNFWLNHIDANGEFTNFSDLGNRCKVEIISRTDLLRAQGYKV